MHEVTSGRWYSGVSLGEVLRYAGVRDAAACGDTVRQQAADAVNEIGETAVPRHVMRECTLGFPEDSLCEIDGMQWRSRSLAAHLRDCDRVLLFAATLGSDTDRLIARHSAVRMSYAILLQGAAAALIEYYCNEQNAAEEARYRREGYYCKPRFSPGYGDFPLACQSALLNHLRAYKLAGIAVSSGGQMTPMKSVSAVIGLTRQKQSGATGSCAGGKCAGCPNRTCAFRQ